MHYKDNLNRKEIGKRIRQIRNDMGLTQEKFAEYINVARGYLSSLETGRAKFSQRVMVGIESICGVHREWLLYGKGKPYIDRWELLVTRARELGEDVYSEFRMLEEEAKEYRKKFGKLTVPPLVIRKGVEILPEECQKLIEREFIHIRLLANMEAAKEPEKVNEKDIEGYAMLHRDKLRYDPEFYICIRMWDDRMAPLLNEGDIVCICHKEKELDRLNRKMVVAIMENEIKIGMLVKLMGKHNLIFYLPHEDSLLKIFNPDKDRILGWAVWWWGEEH